jgi:ParB family chromosome partitioning protein
VSKADTVGDAPSFGAPLSHRRNAIKKAIGGDEAATAAITELPVTLISDNPDNPRNHLRNLDETVETVREVGIILPIVVATVDAYLRDRPDRAGDIDDGAQYLVVDGHRRLEAARRVGLATIPVRVDNGRVATDETLLEAAFVANYHRDDMTDLEEAHALQALVDYYGSQTKASKRLGIPQGTISTKLSLLKLTPELQKDLVTGDRKVEHVRNLGKLSPEEQVEKADARAAASRQPNPEPAQQAPAGPAASGPADYHGVIIPGSPADAPETPPSFTAVKQPALPEARPDTIPEPRADAASANGALPAPDTGDQPARKRFPYEDGQAAAQYLIHRMPPDEFDKMLGLLLDHQVERADATR